MKQFSERRNHDEELKGLLQYLFITTRKYDCAKVARALNMEYNDLYVFVSGRATMPPTLLVKIAAATGDAIFFDTIFAGTNMRVDLVKESRKHSNNLSVETYEAFEQMGKVAEAMKQAVSEGKLSQDLRLRMMNTVTMGIKELQDVFEVLSKTLSLPTVK